MSSEHDEVDLDRPGVRGASGFTDSGEEVPIEKTLRDNLIDLTNSYGRDIPPDVLEQYGIEVRSDGYQKRYQNGLGDRGSSSEATCPARRARAKAREPWRLVLRYGIPSTLR